MEDLMHLALWIAAGLLALLALTTAKDRRTLPVLK
jgi:hypothetical protein